MYLINAVKSTSRTITCNRLDMELITIKEVRFNEDMGLEDFSDRFFLAVAPLLKSGVKTLGKHLWQSGLDVVNDVSRGENLQVAAKRRLKEAGRKLTDSAATKIKNMIGSGHKKGINM